MNWKELSLNVITLGIYGHHQRIQKLESLAAGLNVSRMELIRGHTLIMDNMDRLEKTDRDRYVHFETLLEGFQNHWDREVDKATKAALLEAVRQTKIERKRNGFAVCTNLTFKDFE